MTHRYAVAHWLGTASAIALAAACALNDPPTDDSPPLGGGLPPGVTTAPAAPQTGPVTSPLPSATTEQPPVPDGQPLGNFVERGRGGHVRADSTTRWYGVRLDSIIAFGNRDITEMPIPVARGLVQSIAGALHKSSATRVQNVAVELDSLNVLLGRTPVDGQAVGRSLRRLSGRAAAASPEAGVLAGRVAHLADVLEQAGAKLSRGGR
jgi:hypothetical protein